MTAKATKQFEEVTVRLTDAEIIDMGESLAEKRLAYNQLEATKSETVADYNAKLKALDAEIDELAVAIDAREKTVDVEVRYEPDDGRNLIVTVRADNGQTIGAPRPMTLNEIAEKNMRLQGVLPGLGGAGAEGDDPSDDPGEYEDDVVDSDDDAPDEKPPAAAKAAPKPKANGAVAAAAGKGKRGRAAQAEPAE